MTDTISPCPESSFPLPVDLTFFEARPAVHSVQLTWETASEINCDFFAVEKSRDGIEFEETGRVKGAGQSVVNLRYLFTDNKPYTAESFYRLRQVDYDGSSHYSATVVVDFYEMGLHVLSLPAPGAIDPSIVFSTSSEKTVAYSLFDASGREVHRGDLHPELGWNKISLANLPHGAYLITLRQGVHVLRTKIIL